jgi:hypothetical protein
MPARCGRGVQEAVFDFQLDVQLRAEIAQEKRLASVADEDERVVWNFSLCLHGCFS